VDSPYLSDVRPGFFFGVWTEERLRFLQNDRRGEGGIRVSRIWQRGSEFSAEKIKKKPPQKRMRLFAGFFGELNFVDVQR